VLLHVLAVCLACVLLCSITPTMCGLTVAAMVGAPCWCAGDCAFRHWGPLGPLCRAIQTCSSGCVPDCARFAARWQVHVVMLCHSTLRCSCRGDLLTSPQSCIVDCLPSCKLWDACCCCEPQLPLLVCSYHKDWQGASGCGALVACSHCAAESCGALLPSAVLMPCNMVEAWGGRSLRRLEQV
jgi:hypothetical protein